MNRWQRLLGDGHDLIFYLLDENAKPLDMKNVSGSVKIQNGSKSIKKIDLMEMRGKQTAMEANSEKAFTLVCTITKDGMSYAATFTSKKDLPKLGN